GLTPDQVRARLRAAGYPEGLLDSYLAGADTTRTVMPGEDVFAALSALGITSSAGADSLAALRDSLVGLRADTMHADTAELPIFGMDVFRGITTQFDALQAGPVSDSYRLGPGDDLVLILTGDVETAYSLSVNREGFVFIPQVGQLFVANLTLGQLRDVLFTRLGRVYSGVRRGPGATTHFDVTVSRIRTQQVFVVGDVSRPGAWAISAAGNVLTALYAAGGPTENGSFRRVEVRRGSELVDSLDIYDYLLRGIGGEVRLTTGDVVFVPVHGGRVAVTGEVVRPARYEILPGETLRDVLQMAGGFNAGAVTQRVQIHRILPPDSAMSPGRARVVIDLGAQQFAAENAPGIAMQPGDSVVVFALPEAPSNFVTVSGNVYLEGPVGLTPGMRLSDAIGLAGGPRPDVYLDRILISRMRPDSTRYQLRSAFLDSTDAVTDDILLQDQDHISIFSTSASRPEVFVSVVGAVNQ
ncbi:MAG: SLBB domain-containing protein, partial [Gemmatimonadales bacterium]